MSSRVLSAASRLPVSTLRSLATSCGRTQGAGRSSSPLDAFVAIELERRISELHGRAPRPEAEIVELPIETLFIELERAERAFPSRVVGGTRDGTLEEDDDSPFQFTDEYVSGGAIRHSFSTGPIDGEPGVMSLRMTRYGKGFLIECHHVLQRSQVVQVYDAIGAWLDTPESYFPPEPVV